MDRKYVRIVSPKEYGPIDLIGDYLLPGKGLVGPNNHGKVPSKERRYNFNTMPVL